MNRKYVSSTIDTLLKRTTLANLSNRDAMNHISMLIDAAWDSEHVAGIKVAQSLANELMGRTLESGEMTELQYFIANSWAAMRRALDPTGIQSFSWEQIEVEKEVVFLRKAAISPGFESLRKGRKVQILTNLGGRMSEIGRPFEAIEYWNQALKIAPAFGMALGNKGIGLKTFADHLYDPLHASIYLSIAKQLLKKSIASKTTEERVKADFHLHWQTLKNVPYGLFKSICTSTDFLGKSKLEQDYRNWCLQNTLFLNPINDICVAPIAACDVFGMPDITSRSAEMPFCFKYYNVIKQEYVSARFSYYDAIHSSKVHPSDRNVMTFNTLDYPIHTYSLEQMKSTYRAAYSVFDKIAFFIKEYFHLPLKENSVYFRSIWYVNAHKKNGLDSKFTSSKNWPLRGLFWLSKDLYDDDPEFRNAIDPSAQELYSIRNYIEHKFLSVHDGLFDLTDLDAPKYAGVYRIQLEEFEKKTLQVLKLARAAIIYLSLAVHVDQRRVSREKSNGLKMPMSVEVIDDKWKQRF